jgi:dihydroorotate dehydrogenase electron transfer subunit
VKLHAVEVLHRERFGDHALLRYRWTGAAPEPGQFVMARAVAPMRSLDPFLPRPLFAHDHYDETLSLLFEIRGHGTALLAEEDAGLLVSAPLGRGFALDSGPVALVGGGVWVSPLKLLSRRLAWLGVTRDVYLEIPGTAPSAYGFWISENYPDATLVPTDGSKKDTSQVVLNSLGGLSRYATVYASGPAEMLAAVKHACSGVVLAQLAVRERMACASGSCYGCAVPVWQEGERIYARACVEGPVFGAEVLAW